MKKLRVSFALLSGFLKLLLAFLPETRPLTFLISSKMHRVTTADKISVGFQYLNSENKEVGNIRYNLAEGYFVVFTWPSSFSALRKAEELVKLLSFAIKIIKAEKC